MYEYNNINRELTISTAVVLFYFLFSLLYMNIYVFVLFLCVFPETY
jgi:hypothetical protein